MAQVTLSAFELTAAGRITCRRCSMTARVDGMGILMWDNPKQAIVESTNLDLVHRCSRKLEWYCPSCGSLETYAWGRGWTKTMKCAVCFTVMEQRVSRAS